MPFLCPGDHPDPGIELESPAWAGGFFTTEPPGNPMCGRSGILNAFQLTIVSMSDEFMGHNPHHKSGRIHTELM